MIIPRPCFEPVQVHYAEMGFWAKILHAWRTQPRFKLTADWTIILDDGTRIVFPAGFVTDFASVPRALWFIPGFSPYGPLLCGSIPHDFGYQHGYLLSPYNTTARYSGSSLQARAKYRSDFGEYIPVFLGADRSFFDDLMEKIVVNESGATFVACTAKEILGRFGGIVWKCYRKKGPGAYNTNSLGLPGVAYKNKEL